MLPEAVKSWIDPIPCAPPAATSACVRIATACGSEVAVAAAPSPTAESEIRQRKATTKGDNRSFITSLLTDTPPRHPASLTRSNQTSTEQYFCFCLRLVIAGVEGPRAPSMSSGQRE